MATVVVRRVAANGAAAAANGAGSSSSISGTRAPARHPHDRMGWLAVAVCAELLSGVLNAWLGGWIERHAHRAGVSVAPLLNRTTAPSGATAESGIAVSAAAADAAEGEAVHLHFDAAAAAHDHALPWVDVGIAWLPALHGDEWQPFTRMLPDALVLLLLAVFVAVVVVRGGTAQRVRRVSYFLLLHAATSLLRTCTNSVTIGRPSPICYRALSTRGSFAAAGSSGAGEMGWLFNTNCYDMSISGHTCVSALIGWAVVDAPGWVVPWGWKAVTGATAVVSALAQVMVGDHYSVDVVLALYVATSAYWLARNTLRATYGAATATVECTTEAAAHNSPGSSISSTVSPRDGSALMSPGLTARRTD